MKKRVLPLLLALTMVLSLLPAAVAAEPLATPTELEWGKSYSQADPGETQTCTQVPGSISWRKEMPHQEEFSVSIYDAGGKKIAGGVWVVPGEGYASVDEFILRSKELDSGDYTFGIQALGDEINYFSGVEAYSQSWTYTKPAGELQTITGLRWNWPEAGWTALAGADFSCYNVQWFYSETEEGSYENVGESWLITKPVEKIGDIYIQNQGVGYYKFRVRGISRDITRLQHGAWSELSPAFALTDLTDSIKNGLDAITSSDPDVIRNEVYNLNTDGLKSAMLADNGGDGVISRLTELEKKAGGPAKTELTGNVLPGFTDSDVSIVGAGLNFPAQDGSALKLTVGEPQDKDLVIPTLLSSTLAIKFSMNLEGVAWPEFLDVPVKVTLPVPATINPDFLRIVHYPADGGEPEIMGPLSYHVFRENGKAYASFVLTHFSDFAMTELKREGPDPDQPEAKPLVITGVELEPKTYDATTEAKVTAVTFEGLSAGETLSLGADYTASARFADAKAGENKKLTVEVELKSSGYSLAKKKFETAADIARAVVTVSAKSETIQKGSALPQYTYTFSGLVEQDKTEPWKEEPSAACSVANSNTPGSYDITVSGGTLKETIAPNYRIEYVKGTLEITSGGSSSSGDGGSSSGGGSSSSSGGGSSSSIKNTVSIPAKPEHGKVTLSVSSARKGDTVTLTAAPDEGYKLEELTVTDKNGKKLTLKELGEGKFSFAMPDGKVEVKASFAAEEEKKAEAPAPTQPVAERFNDVKAGGWYQAGVQYVYDRGMMTGLTKESFGPDVPTSRAMLVTILYRLENEPQAGQAGFGDVTGTAYYASPVAWAAENGLVAGYGDGSFRPNEALTREQLVTILFRYAKWKGYDTARGEKSAGFQDEAGIKSYAREAVEWAASIGLVGGYEDGTFRPEGAATRAEIATMLMRFCQNVAKAEG